MVPRTIAAAALVLAAASTAEAGSLSVKNCSSLSINVTVLRPDSGESAGEKHLIPGGTGTLYCPAAACPLQVVYYATTPRTGSFPGPYGSDRCTRGLQDIPVGDLPAAGNCGC
ncbi:MAG: hypothetical protein AB7P02_31575 [Alphaproteobacteria bacterium]